MERRLFSVLIATGLVGCGTDGSGRNDWFANASSAPSSQGGATTTGDSTGALAGSGGAAPAVGSGGAPTAGSQSASPSNGCSSTVNAFDLIQAKIFDAHGCSGAVCHGSAMSGGLTLTSGSSYSSLVGVAAHGSSLQRVAVGQPDKSFLYQKLEAATNPGSVTVAGSPMPLGASPLSAAELQAVQAWISAGAPATGSVSAPSGSSTGGDYVASLLCGVTQMTVTTGDTADLEPPASDKGVQFTMPAYTAKAGSEWEGCFATYYDFTKDVPERYKSPDGTSFYVDSTDIRLTQGGHHLAIINTPLAIADMKDISFGKWTCNGGPTDGGSCDPSDTSGCGAGGFCMSTPQATLGCIGYGPPSANINPAGFGLGTALQARQTVPRIDGVYRAVPLKAVVFWDFHAINATNDVRTMHAHMNMTFADDRRLLEQRLTIYGALDGANGVPPFKKQELCDTWIAPKGTRMLRLTTHTHKRGQHFRAWDPSGNQIYDSTDYSNPAYVTFDPPLEFNSDLDSERTLKFCSVYNNGLNPDGTPNLDLLTQVSLTPGYEIFKPQAVACSKGKWGSPCFALLGDAQCDSSPGAGDGKCDAAAIHFGQTTASEMFFFTPDIVNPDASSAEATTNVLQSVGFGNPLPNVDVK